jgi:signal transduction histidine kinase
MQAPMMAGDFALPEAQEWDDSLEFIASEMRLPLSLIRQSAVGLAQQLREMQGDPTDISAAEDLAESADKMNHIVQALIRISRDMDF